MLTNIQKNNLYPWYNRLFSFVSLLGCLGLPNLSLAQLNFQDIAAAQQIMHNYGVQVPSGGVSFYDFNGDGWDDLTLATEIGQPIAIYQNDHGHFKAIESFFPDETLQGQVLWVDYDNDGDKDFFMASLNGANRLYQNDGHFNMTDVTAQVGLTTEQFLTYGAAFGDFDRDGWLDLYLGKRTGVPSENTHLLYKNRGDGTFVEVARAKGADDPAKIPFCSAFFDYNNDSWPDIYTANDRFSGNTLLRNNKNGTFTDVSSYSRTGINMNAMSVTVGDYNNDQLPDIYVTNTQGGNVLLRNNGNENFTEVAAAAGVGFYSVGWGALFFDADNDGWQDLYVSGALPGPEINSSAFYYNLQDGSFSQPDVGFSGDTVASYSNALGDFNRDGKADIVVMNRAPYNSQLWSNQTQTDHHWISVQLEGVLSNRDAIGSHIQIYAGALTTSHFTQCGTGFLGQNSSSVLFGLGQHSVVDSLVIRWPTGHADRLYDIASGEEVYIVEGSTTGGDIEVSPEVQLLSSTNHTLRKPAPFTIFPNPADQQLQLTWQRDQPQGRYSVQLIQPTGQVRALSLRSQRGKETIGIGHLPPGVYWIQVWAAQGQVWQQKFVKL